MPESIPPAVAPACGRGEMCADYSAAGFDADPNPPDTDGARRCGRSRPAPQTGGKHPLFHAGVADAIGRQYGDQRRRDGLSGPLHAMGSAGARSPVESGRWRSLGMARPGNGASCRTRASRPQTRTGGPPPKARHMAKRAGRLARGRLRFRDTWIPASAGMTDMVGMTVVVRVAYLPRMTSFPRKRESITVSESRNSRRKIGRPALGSGPALSGRPPAPDRTRAIQPVPTSEPHPRYPTGSGDAPVRASAMATPPGGRPSRLSSRGGTP